MKVKSILKMVGVFGLGVCVGYLMKTANSLTEADVQEDVDDDYYDSKIAEDFDEGEPDRNPMGSNEDVSCDREDPAKTVEVEKPCTDAWESRDNIEPVDAAVHADPEMENVAETCDIVRPEEC